jgi:hypothetical protein
LSESELEEFEDDSSDAEGEVGKMMRSGSFRRGVLEWSCPVRADRGW